jgi:hypothetical protein
MLSQDFKEFVELLNQYEVAYLIVGGYALGIHGYPRYTGDLDVWINPTATNAQKMLRVFAEFGFASFGLTEADFSNTGNVIQLGYPPFRIDVLTKPDGVTFLLVPTLCVGMPVWEGRSASRAYARRRASKQHSHAERGNEKVGHA